MGGALLRGGVASGALSPERVVVAEPDGSKREALGANARVVGTVAEALATGASHGVVLLAVKPQMFAGVAEEPGVLWNSSKNPLYVFCFAVGNERGKDIALRIANHLLKTIIKEVR